MFIYLDKSAKTRKAKVDGWENKIRDGAWGKYGWWCMVNVNPMDFSVAVTDEAAYAGDGFYHSWHIKWG